MMMQMARGAADLSDPQRAVLAQIEQAKQHIYNLASGNFRLAREQLDAAIHDLTAMGCASREQTESCRLWAYAHFQRSRAARISIDAAGLSIHSPPHEEIAAGIAAAQEAVRAYTVRFGSGNCEEVRDARLEQKYLEEQAQVCAESDGPARWQSSRREGMTVRMCRIDGLPPSMGQDTYTAAGACQLELTLDRPELPWGGPPTWDAAMACPSGPSFFLCGPFCAFDGADDRGWLERYMSGSPSVDYPPTGYLLSCPGCGVACSDAPIRFLSLQYMRCKARETDTVIDPSGRHESLRNKVCPRGWCLRCVRDVLVPLGTSHPAPSDGSTWPHLRRLPFALPSLWVATAYWQTTNAAALDRVMAIEGLQAMLDAPSRRPHSMDHLYHTMMMRDQRATGAVTFKLPGKDPFQVNAGLSFEKGDGRSIVWRTGMQVKLTGLSARPELNGSVGEVLGSVDPESGRVPVRLVAPGEYAGERLRAKPINLTRHRPD
jgi:hypothetical protein